MPEGEWEPQHLRDTYESEYGIIGHRGQSARSQSKWYNHMPGYEIKELLGEDTWNSYFKFCVIRDPWEKAISAYFHFGQNHTEKPRRRLMQRLRHPFYNAQQQHFLCWLKYGHPPIDQHIYQIDGKSVLNSHIRYEQLSEDIQKICQQLNLPWEPDQIPRFKSEKRDRTVTPDQLYTAAADQIIRERYAYEIETFQYDR